MNNFNLVGVVVSEPEKGVSASGINFCKLHLAVERNPGKEEAEEPEIYEVTVFRNYAKMDYRIGQSLAISGRLQANNYEKDNNLYYNIRLSANSVVVIG